MVWVFSPKDGDPSCLSKDQRPSAVRDGSFEAALSPDLLRSSLLEPRFQAAAANTHQPTSRRMGTEL